MTIEELQLTQKHLDSMIKIISRDPVSTNTAYNRYLEKMLSSLECAQMWNSKAINILKNEM